MASCNPYLDRDDNGKYRDLKIADLRAELRKRRAKLSGKKQELIERYVLENNTVYNGCNEQLLVYMGGVTDYFICTSLSCMKNAQPLILELHFPKTIDVCFKCLCSIILMITLLCSRLESYDRNDNFGRGSVPDKPEWHMTIPELSTYKDIHQDSPLPKLKLEDVENYLTINNASLQEKAKSLYNDGFLMYARYANDNSTFIHSKCHAEMKKSTTYFTDIKLDRDGVVEEAQCDCGAGMGPDAHCKHVQTVLWGILKWASTGEIKTEETCTQRLQTFHKAKKFKGSPVKCADLDLGTEGDFTYDPRPEKYRENKGYPDFVRNLVINSQSDHRMPISTTIEPANTKAIVSDHAYLANQPEDQFLIDNNISAITEDTIAEIESHTRNQATSKAWKQHRTMRLTSSNFGRISTATEATDFHKLAAGYTLFQDIKSKSINHGKQYESKAVEKLEEKLEITTSECGLFVSGSHPYLAGSPDRLFGDDTVVEVKCPYTAKDKPLSPLTVPYLKEEDQTLKLDSRHAYHYQIQGQMFVTGRRWALFGVYASVTKEIKIVKIERDEAFIKAMVKKLEKFYECYFKAAVLKRFYHHNYSDYTFQPDVIFNDRI